VEVEMVEKLPIVYVRGFAGDTSGINKAVADPFYGFNEGSTHVRVGGDGEPIFYQFESPLLRLHFDEEYQILVQGGQLAYLDSHEKVPPTASGSIASTTSPPPPGLSGHRTTAWNAPPRTCLRSSRSSRPRPERRGLTWSSIPWAG
jgi:hypothetical protein